MFIKKVSALLPIKFTGERALLSYLFFTTLFFVSSGTKRDPITKSKPF